MIQAAKLAHIPVELLQPGEQRHVNTTTFEQQLAACALTPATFIDNFGSVRSVAKPDLDQATEHAVTASPVFRFGLQCNWCTLIGQPIYKNREVLKTVGSVASAFTQATLPPLGGVHPLGPPRPGNPVEGNGMHTRLKGLSHRVIGRAVNCPLLGPPGLRSSLGG